MGQLKSVLELDPNYAIAHIQLGQVYVQKRMYDVAIEEFQKSIALSEQNPDIVAQLGHAYALSGRRSEARTVLAKLFKLSKRAYVSPYMIACVYTGLEQQDRAFEMLEKGYQERDSHLVDVSLDPRLDPLRSDPRYTDLLRRVGLPERP
jgi:tetratricopeptide (TPR) repeat protein